MRSNMHNIAMDTHRGIMQRTLVPYFIEWCEPPQEAVRGVACKDTSFKLNSVGPDFTTNVDTSPDANLYTYVDLPLLDPVEDGVSKGVIQFLSQTLWGTSIPSRLQCTARPSLSQVSTYAEQLGAMARVVSASHS